MVLQSEENNGVGLTEEGDGKLEGRNGRRKLETRN
jgi:hypothetical protein